MSDPKSSYGEPVEEPTTVDHDVVGRAHEGLAHAEAAGRDAVADEPSRPVVTDAAPADAPVDAAPKAAAPAEPDPWDSPEAASLDYQRAAPATVAYDSPAADTGAATPVVTASEPVSETHVAPAPVAPQPIFVQAPEAPTPRGNRAAVGAIGLLAALSFAVLYFAAWLGFGAILGDITTENIAERSLAALGTWSLWVPVVVFFFAFWLLGAIINRGRWGAWVIFGIFVGIASYGGYILGQFFEAPFWMLTPSEGVELFEQQLFAPLAIAAFVIGRELTIWFGAWAAARGRRVTELNVEAQREYERTLEAGPQLVRQ
jgi:hypothetical protein